MAPHQLCVLVFIVIGSHEPMPILEHLLSGHLSSSTHISCGSALSGGTKVCTEVPDHITKMATMSLKTLKNLL